MNNIEVKLVISVGETDVLTAMNGHIFNPEKKHLLDSPERQRILPAFNTLKYLGLKKGDIFLDIGCGTGYFSIPAIRITSSTGRVIGIDSQPEMLKAAQSRIDGENLNAEFLTTDGIQLPLADKTGTFLLMSNVLHEAEDRLNILTEAIRVLKPRGKIAIIEWERREMPMGPPVSERMLPDEITALIVQAGFKMPKMFPVGEYHIGFTAIKK